jgi:hypothetical protein
MSILEINFEPVKKTNNGQAIDSLAELAAEVYTGHGEPLSFLLVGSQFMAKECLDPQSAQRFRVELERMINRGTNSVEVVAPAVGTYAEFRDYVHTHGGDTRVLIPYESSSKLGLIVRINPQSH